MLEGLILTSLKQIVHPKGDIFHAMKSIDVGFNGFGEAYFSEVLNGEVKGWKKHREMVLNIVVPQGAIRFVAYDDRPSSPTNGDFYEVELSTENYYRLTIPNGIWLAFQGVGKSRNLLLNMASIPHDPKESEVCDIDDIKFGWK